MGEKTVIDYTKYRIKPEKEVREVLTGTSSIYILWCKKCFSAFEQEAEKECPEEVLKIVRDMNIEVIGCTGIDFLCNNYLTEKILKKFTGNSPVAVISCGIGIQFVGNFFSGRCRTIALADSIPSSGNATSITGYHGIALGEEKCAACGQCELEKTGGICPVVGCAKSLLNGPCGGANKDGRCEVNKELPCAWIEIYKRLDSQKRHIGKTLDIRDHNVFPVGEKGRYIKENQGRRSEGFYGGVYPLERKELTEAVPLKDFNMPEVVYIFLSQHTGIPAKAVVEPGDRVRKGQKIGEAEGFVSATVHSPVSGKVITIEDKIHPVSQIPQPAIIIENDGAETLDSSVEPLIDWQELPKEKLLNILKEKGIVGLGGAMFPSSIKLCPPKVVDTLIVNGCECEPYLNADNRLMIELPDSILKGIEIVRRILGVSDVVFAIEDNKSEALESVNTAVKEYSGIKVETLKTKYPQGAERMLIKRTTGREVPEGGLPFDVGVVVFNVGTLYAISRAIHKGMPLIERVITVGVETATFPGNYIVKIGTKFADIMKVCFGTEELPDRHNLTMGGPMMGIVQKDINSAVIKGTTGILLLKNPPICLSEENICIRCGRCVDVCPMELLPYYYAYYGEKGQWDEMANYKVKSCIECGCCQYICSSKIDIVSLVKKAKKNANNKT
ncbi:MAG: electron transport complex subunit RsxC [Candidatus Ratteibacteria bacterium]|nr:electron transport complex subunit RsxC [Candidatus Ratteibacteria bacterium]